MLTRPAPQKSVNVWPGSVSDSTNKPPIPPSTPNLPVPQRRAAGGPRHASSSRIRLSDGALEIEGWTLNVSRGGSRIIVEDPVERDANYLMVTDEETAPRSVRVVWVREESGGQIVGLQYLDCDGSIPPAEEPDDVP